ncbi:MAG TPA: response regulator transcription factor [Terriglobia bacterium]|nr:response regulator transcription factor [Terriglobia bacterium]
MPVRILLADDHEIVRRGLRAILEAQADWQVTDEAANGLEAVEKAERTKPDLVVMDISMPGMNGLEAARRIRLSHPGVEVLFLTMHESEQMIREGIDAGARGYLLKSDAGIDLVTAVKSVSRHRPFFSHQIAGPDSPSREGRNQSKVRGQGRASVLTSREREVVQLLAEGKSTKEVASALQIAVKTAATHRTNILRKLGLHSIADLVRYAIRNRIVEV